MTIETSPQGIKHPADCTDMAEVRAGVDDVDAQLVQLLARRFGYMEAAARIKRDRDTVRDEVRKAQVIANARKAALDLRIPQDVIADMWETLVEGSIAYEYGRWDALRG
ncbi:MAG: chorismate mutase [Sphingorhabdus sp.]